MRLCLMHLAIYYWKTMIYKTLNGVKTYAPQSRKELIDYAFQNKAILVAINAEKILHATDESRDIINRNLGYPDGIGAVWALQNFLLRSRILKR